MSESNDVSFAKIETPMRNIGVLLHGLVEPGGLDLT